MWSQRRTAVHMEQKTLSKFLPCPGQNLGPWHLAAADVATRLPRTPSFSRLLRHAGGYSRTILTLNLQFFYLSIILFINPASISAILSSSIHLLFKQHSFHQSNFYLTLLPPKADVPALSSIPLSPIPASVR